MFVDKLQELNGRYTIHVIVMAISSVEFGPKQVSPVDQEIITTDLIARNPKGTVDLLHQFWVPPRRTTNADITIEIDQDTHELFVVVTNPDQMYVIVTGVLGNDLEDGEAKRITGYHQKEDSSPNPIE